MTSQLELGAAFVGTAEQCEAVRQFARDYDWSDTQPRIEDPDYAADAILAELRDRGGD